MTLKLELRLTGKSEEVVRALMATGLREEEVLAKALWMLNLVRETNRVAVLRPGMVNSPAAESVVESFLTLDPTTSSRTSEPDIALPSVVATPQEPDSAQAAASQEPESAQTTAAADSLPPAAEAPARPGGSLSDEDAVG